jgi:hypothetical protein
MMALQDFNRTLVPPAGFALRRVSAVGAFLVLAYFQEAKGGRVELEIFLNDQGREVIRTMSTVEYKPGEKSNVNANQDPGR